MKKVLITPLILFCLFSSYTQGAEAGHQTRAEKAKERAFAKWKLVTDRDMAQLAPLQGVLQISHSEAVRRLQPPKPTHPQERDDLRAAIDAIRSIAKTASDSYIHYVQSKLQQRQLEEGDKDVEEQAMKSLVDTEIYAHYSSDVLLKLARESTDLVDQTDVRKQELEAHCTLIKKRIDHMWETILKDWQARFAKTKIRRDLELQLTYEPEGRAEMLPVMLMDLFPKRLEVSSSQHTQNRTDTASRPSSPTLGIAWKMLEGPSALNTPPSS